MLIKVYRFSWLVILAGFTLKLLHFPIEGLLLASGGGLLLIHAFIHFAINKRVRIERSLYYLTIALVTIYFETRFQFLGISRIIFWMACLSLLTWMIVLVKRKVSFDLPKYVLVIYFIFITWFSFIPSYKIYYFVNLHPLLNKTTSDSNYMAWDRYSWFLYIRDQYDESFEANQKAHEASRKVQEAAPDNEAKKYEDILMQHEFQIVHREWETYP